MKFLCQDTFFLCSYSFKNKRTSDFCIWKTTTRVFTYFFSTIALKIEFPYQMLTMLFILNIVHCFCDLIMKFSSENGRRKLFARLDYETIVPGPKLPKRCMLTVVNQINVIEWTLNETALHVILHTRHPVISLTHCTKLCWFCCPFSLPQ